MQNYRERGIIPFSRIGGKYFYRDCDVAAYLESRTEPKSGINAFAGASHEPELGRSDTVANMETEKK